MTVLSPSRLYNTRKFIDTIWNSSASELSRCQAPIIALDFFYLFFGVSWHNTSTDLTPHHQFFLMFSIFAMFYRHLHMNIFSFNKYVFNYALSLHVYTFMMVVSISFRCNFSHSDSDTSFWLVVLEFIFFVWFCFWNWRDYEQGKG